jgi:hypothetical protein
MSANRGRQPASRRVPDLARLLRVVVAAAALALAGVTLGRSLVDQHEGAVAVAAWSVTYLLLGAFLLVRTNSPAIATIVLVIGTAAGVNPGDEVGWSYRLGVVLFLTFTASWALLIHCFPTGRPMVGWWRWPARGLLGSAAVLVVGQLLSVSFEESSAPLRAVIVLTSTLFAIGLAMALPAIVVRYLRSTGQQRAQLKWFVFAVVTSVAFWFLPVVDQLSPLLPALAIGIAITRYRLFDIDRLVSRTVAYALATGCVLLTYAVAISLATWLVPHSSNLAVAAATLAAAAVARPVLGAVQERVDRRFNRPRFDAQRSVEEFGSTLRTVVTPDHVVAELRAVLVRTVQPAGLSIWLRSPS